MKKIIWIPLLAFMAIACSPNTPAFKFSLNSHICALLDKGNGEFAFSDIALQSSFHWTSSMDKSLEKYLTLSITEGDAGVTTIQVKPTPALKPALNAKELPPFLGNIYFHANGQTITCAIMLDGMTLSQIIENWKQGTENPGSAD